MKNLNSRRDFIKTSALVTGGILAPAFIVPGAYAAPANELKLAVIGCGGRGTGAVFQAFATGHPIKLVAMLMHLKIEWRVVTRRSLTSTGPTKWMFQRRKDSLGLMDTKKSHSRGRCSNLGRTSGFSPISF